MVFFFVLRSGDLQWRDKKTPTEILEDFTSVRGLAHPKYYGDIGVKIANKTYNIADFGKSTYYSSTEDTDTITFSHMYICN